MPDIARHEPGMLCFARRSYGELFGWSLAETWSPLGRSRLAHLRGRAVAGLYQLTPGRFAVLQDAQGAVFGSLRAPAA